MPVIVVYGGQFGDEGKGKIAETFANLYDAVAVVRVGGSQADHTGLSGAIFNVLPTCAGKRISVLPSGSYIRLDRLYKEMEGLSPEQLIIDMAACIVIDDDIQEASTSGRTDKIASHGLGTRSAIQRRLRGDFREGTLPMHYERLRPYVKNVRKYYSQWLQEGRYIILEGTQGFGLSNHLFDLYPYTTSRTITPYVFCCEAGLDPACVEERVMCLRSFPIRVAGNSGPLPRETTWAVVTNISGSKTPIVACPKNTGNTHRVAFFDADIVLRAIYETKPTKIVLNMLDYIDVECQAGIITPRAELFINLVQQTIKRDIDYVGVRKDILLKLLDYRGDSGVFTNVFGN